MAALKENAITKMTTTSGVDATLTGSTTIFNVPAGKIFIPDHIVVRVTSFTVGTKSTQAVASFGGNSPTFNDYINSTTYTVAANNVFIKDSVEDSAVTTQAASTVFSIIIDTASNATTEIWAVDLFGYLL